MGAESIFTISFLRAFREIFGTWRQVTCFVKTVCFHSAGIFSVVGLLIFLSSAYLVNCISSEIFDSEYGEC
jgi:hypothetical protein